MSSSCVEVSIWKKSIGPSLTVLLGIKQYLCHLRSNRHSILMSESKLHLYIFIATTFLKTILEYALFQS